MTSLSALATAVKVSCAGSSQKPNTLNKDRAGFVEARIKSSGYACKPWERRKEKPIPLILSLKDFEWEMFPVTVSATDVMFPDRCRPELTITCGSDYSMIYSNSLKSTYKALYGHSGRIISVCVTASRPVSRGQRLAISCSADKSCKLWSLDGGDCVTTLNIEAQDACFTSFDSAIVVASKSDLKIYSHKLSGSGEAFGNKRQKRTLTQWGSLTDSRVGHSIDLIGTQPLSLGGWLISVSSNRNAQLWDLHKEVVVCCATDIFKSTALALTVSDHTESVFAIASADNFVRLWDSRTMSMISQFNIGFKISRGTCQRISLGGPFLHVPSECGNLVTIDTRSGKYLMTKFSNGPLFATDSVAGGVCVTHNNSISFQTSR